MKLSRIYSQMSDDQLLDVYTDLGAMGSEMDVDHTEWDVICREMERRTPIPFRLVGEGVEYYHDPETNAGGYYSVEVDLTRQEAINSIRNKIPLSVWYFHGNELKYIPNVLLKSYWDDENKKLVAIPDINVDELPF